MPTPNAVQTAPAQTQPQNSWPLSRIVKLVSLPVSILSGYLVTRAEVRWATNLEGVKDGKLSKLVEQHKIDIAEFNSQRGPGVSAEQIASVLAKENENIAAFRHAADTEMHRLGRGSFLSRLRYIPRSAAQKAIIDGATVGTIVLGATLTLANSKMLTSIFKGEKDTDGPTL